MMETVIASTLVSLAMIGFFTNQPFLLSCLGWAMAYTALASFFKLFFRRACEVVDGYPRYAYYGCITHQGIVLPFFALGVLWTHSVDYTPWWFGTDNTYRDLWVYLSYTSTVGALLKDYWVYGDVNEWFILVHHLVSIYGCCFAMNAPSQVGRVILTGIQAECFSCLSNIKSAFPSRSTRIVHVIGFTLSNLFAILMAVECCMLPTSALVPLSFKISFAVVVFILSLVRFGAVYFTWREIQRHHPECVRHLSLL